MSHNASDAQKLLSVDIVIVAPAVGSPFQVTKGLTASSPALTGVRHFQLPDPTTIPAGMSYEIKDSGGNAATTGNQIVIMTPGSVTIDGGTADDEITKNFGSKTYVNLGSAYIVRGDQLAVAGVASGGGSYLADFGGSDGDPLPGGWSSVETGTGIPWLISTDVFHSSGGNLSSAGSDSDPETAYLGSASLSSPAISTLTYSAGTLDAGTVVSFKWLRDTYDSGYVTAETVGYRQWLAFNVNGLQDARHSVRKAWQSHSYTVPATGTYQFSWVWTRSVAYFDATTNNGCFLDEFTIT
jgi:hypothetical protein